MMAATRLNERASPVAFFEQQVAPVVFERLDELFPEFGFTRDHHGWRATNSETTRAFFGARAERVVCHQSGGFYIHGQGPVAMAQPPRERRHATRARLRRCRPPPRPRGRRRHQSSRSSRVASRAARLRASHAIREAWFQHAVELLRHPRAEPMAAPTSHRAASTDTQAIEGLVGVAPHQPEAWRRLTREGHDRDAINASGVLADSRTPGRIVGAWRDESGSVATIWARSTTPPPSSRERYLYTRGARRPALSYLAYESSGPEVVIVEGVLDALVMRAHGYSAAVALGGSNASEATWRALARHGIRHAWLLADHDPAGDQACRAATRTLLRADSAPRLSIRLPQFNAEHKDMADLLEAHPETSIDAAWLDGCCVDCVEHETRSILSAAGTTSSKRQLAFDQATRFLASVPDRHALGREAAVRTLASWARVDAAHHPRRHSHPRGRKQPPRARPTPRDGDHHSAQPDR